MRSVFEAAIETGNNVILQLVDGKQEGVFERCGIPAEAIKTASFPCPFGRTLLIILDPNYRQHQDIECTDDGVGISLSFDSLCRCFFPWSYVMRVSVEQKASCIWPEEEQEPVAAEVGQGSHQTPAERQGILFSLDDFRHRK